MTRVQEVIAVDGSVVRREPHVGDLKWEGARWRSWNGRSWAVAAYSLSPERLSDPAPLTEEPEIEARRRQRALALAVEDQVAAQGATVVFEGPSGVVLAYPRRVSHVLHAVLTVLTGGLWAIVWLVMALNRREDRIRLEPDFWGNVWSRPVAGAP